MTALPPDDDAIRRDAADADAAQRAESEAQGLRWARKMTDRIPTGWIITGAGAVLLGATAAFGGLAPAPEEKPVEIAVGEDYRGSDLDMTVLGAAVSGPATEPDDGLRRLVVEMDVTNEFTEPRLARSPHTLAGVRIEGVRLDGLEVSRVDDGSNVLNLQPGVRTRVEVTWVVDAGEVSAGDEIQIVLPESTRFEGSFVTRGTYWDDVRPGALVTVEVGELPEETS